MFKEVAWWRNAVFYGKKHIKKNHKNVNITNNDNYSVNYNILHQV